MSGRNKVWTTKDGRKVKVKDMTDSHLTNTLKFLARAAQRRCSRATAGLVNCPTPQGEYAQMAVESELDAQLFATWDDYVPDIFWDMSDEFEKRGLDTQGLQDYYGGVEDAGLALEIDAICGRLESNGR